METFLDYAPVPIVVESSSGEILWSNQLARTSLGSLPEGWKQDRLHQRPEGLLFVNDGHHFAVRNQSLVFEGEPAELYWFFPMLSTIEQERDPLTGLPSFGSFLRSLERYWTESQTNTFALGLVTIDISRFSILNDVLGATACDDLLCQAARRFSKLLESEDLLSRVNGDQFVVMLTGATDVSDLHPNSVFARGEALIHRVVNDLDKPFYALDQPVQLQAAIGMSTSTLCENPSELIASSHRAMMGAKSNGNPDFVVFNREMLKDQQRLKTLARELNVALNEGQISLVYQPFVDLQSGKLVGAEALLRWEHPVHGLLRPNQFLGAAEVSNMMFPIGRWAIEKVVEVAHAHPNLLFSLNLSSQQLLAPDFSDVLFSQLKSHQVRPESIVLEILESSSSTTLDSLRQVLETLSEARVGLALDDADFDTRALLLLSSLSLRYVKVDRKIVAELDQDNVRNFCKAMLALTQSLGKKGLAVGVESLEQSQYLSRLGCDWGQGNFFSPPSPPEMLEAWTSKPFLV